MSMEGCNGQAIRSHLNFRGLFRNEDNLETHGPPTCCMNDKNGFMYPGW